MEKADIMRWELEQRAKKVLFVLVLVLVFVLHKEVLELTGSHPRLSRVWLARNIAYACRGNREPERPTKWYAGNGRGIFIQANQQKNSTSKQASKQASKQTSKQTSKQANKQAGEPKRIKHEREAKRSPTKRSFGNLVRKQVNRIQI